MSKTRIVILIGYVAVFSLFSGLFGAKNYYEAQIAGIKAGHSVQMAMVRDKQQAQLDRVWDKALAQARAEVKRAEVREYHRGKYEACVMEYVAFGRSLNCNAMVIKGFEAKAHDRSTLKSWDRLWREILNLKSG